MNKVLFAIVTSCVALSVNAASVGWSIGKTDASYKGDAYQFFVVGQNGVTSIDAIKLLLDAGTDVSDKTFGSGTLTSNAGGVTQSYSSSGKTLDAGTYETFFVIYDSPSPVAGTAKYIVLTGGTLSQTFAATKASVTFQAQDQSSAVANADNWASFGTATPTPDPDPVPEPTTVALLALGLAAVGLKRKVA